jgi:hypothetical protein
VRLAIAASESRELCAAGGLQRERSMRIVLSLALLIPACALELEAPDESTATAAIATCTHYVATTGSNVTGDATRVRPWQTLQYAVDHVSAGSTVCAAVGVYNENVFFTRSGEPGLPITLTIDPASIDPGTTGEVIVDGTIRRPGYGSCPPAIWILGQSHITISRLTVINHGNPGFPGVPSGGVVSFRPCLDGGIWVGTQGSANAEGIVIENNVVREINPARADQIGVPIGISSFIPGLSAHHVQVRNNLLYGSDTASDLIMTGHVGIAGDVHDFEVRGNIFDDADSAGIDTGGNLSGTNLHPARGVIADNQFLGSGRLIGGYGVGVTTEPPCDVTSPTIGGTALIRNNLFIDSTYSDLVAGAFFGSNVCPGAPGPEYLQVSDVYFTNNTIFRPASSPAIASIYAPHNGDYTLGGESRFINNIIITAGIVFDIAQPALPAFPLIIDHNYIASPLGKPFVWNATALTWPVWRAQHDPHSTFLTSTTTSIFAGPGPARSHFHLAGTAGAPPKNAGMPAIHGIPATTPSWANLGDFAPKAELDHYGGVRDNGRRDLGADEY